MAQATLVWNNETLIQRLVLFLLWMNEHIGVHDLKIVLGFFYSNDHIRGKDFNIFYFFTWNNDTLNFLVLKNFKTFFSFVLINEHN
jgi:hypothetical protein